MGKDHRGPDIIQFPDVRSRKRRACWTAGDLVKAYIMQCRLKYYLLDNMDTTNTAFVFHLTKKMLSLTYLRSWILLYIC